MNKLSPKPHHNELSGKCHTYRLKRVVWLGSMKLRRGEWNI